MRSTRVSRIAAVRPGSQVPSLAVHETATPRGAPHPAASRMICLAEAIHVTGVCWLARRRSLVHEKIPMTTRMTAIGHAIQAVNHNTKPRANSTAPAAIHGHDFTTPVSQSGRSIALCPRNGHAQGSAPPSEPS
jgi:hypothetical protein